MMQALRQFSEQLGLFLDGFAIAKSRSAIGFTPWAMAVR
jgi:hypothetical protein